MLNGNAVLEELSARGKRYTRLTYQEHQALKAANAPQDLQAFFNDHDYAITVADEASVETIVDEIVAIWKQRQAAETKQAILSGLVSHPLGLVLLLLALPFYACFRIVRVVAGKRSPTTPRLNR
ncbi:hypothetical protein Pla123a_10730 [Posidoniimonas polymericola]|uniref:Uncharacterized protein n=2 Tax=Posidoniimonas polymericola TaxID=2528002 RepID=A0A5C5YTF6_9BACT|nr:hypothetical protein Pla123a_10730 [Posidoniimonas polymericola]